MVEKCTREEKNYIEFKLLKDRVDFKDFDDNEAVQGYATEYRNTMSVATYAQSQTAVRLS